MDIFKLEQKYIEVIYERNKQIQALIEENKKLKQELENARVQPEVNKEADDLP